MDIRLKKKYLLISVFIFFAAFYAFISLGRHYSYRSTAFDLGIYNQALYRYAHFTTGPNTILRMDNLLGDHFEVLMLLLSPFYWIFGSYTLLVVQLTAILIGGYGIYLLAKDTTGDDWLSLGTTVIFFLSFGLFGAMVFDYHNNVIGAMFLPWMLLAIRQKKWKRFYLMFLFFLLAKETLALLGIFLGLSIILFRKEARRHGAITMGISAIYFFVVLQFVIPWFNHGRQYLHWFYEHLGTGPADALWYVVRHPLSAGSLLFDNSAKIYTWIVIFMGGGAAVIFSLPEVVLLAPLLAEKFFSSYANSWGINFHYNIELCLIIALGLPTILHRLRPRVRYTLLTVFVVNSVAIFYLLVLNLKPFSIFGYEQRTRREIIAAAIRLIPPSAPVSATDNIMPHLSQRRRAYLFPEIADSEFIILDARGYIFPHKSRAAYGEGLEQALALTEFTRVIDQNGIYLLQRTGKRDNIRLPYVDDEEKVFPEWWNAKKNVEAVSE